MSDMQINIIKGNISLNNKNVKGNISLKNKNIKGKLTMPERTKAYINYEDDHELYNRPRINDVELVGNKTSKDIHVQHEMGRITEQMIDKLFYGG